MKYNIELVLFVILIIFMYYKPVFLMELTQTGLGRLVLIIFVVVVGQMYGTYAGLLSSILVIILLQSIFEGMEGMEDNGREEQEEKKILLTSVLNSAVEEIKQDVETIENNGKITTNNELINNEPNRNIINSRDENDIIANLDLATSQTGEEEIEPSIPVLTEGFATY